MPSGSVAMSRIVMQISASEYNAASPDPVAQFSRPIGAHMNADHADSTAAMVPLAVLDMPASDV